MLPKNPGFAKKAIVDGDKIYLFPKASEDKFEIVTLPDLDLESADFVFAKQLVQARKFYDVGFKERSFTLYDSSIKQNSQQFEKYYTRSSGDKYIALNAYVDLSLYKSTKDTKKITSYIWQALDSNYISEAKKALDVLKATASTAKDKAIYDVLYAAYLLELGKDEQAYSILINNMPFSKEIRESVLEHSKSAIMLFKDSSKASLIFDISPNIIEYVLAKKRVEFVSYAGKLLKPPSPPQPITSVSNQPAELEVTPTASNGASGVEILE